MCTLVKFIEDQKGTIILLSLTEILIGILRYKPNKENFSLQTRIEITGYDTMKVV